VNREYFGDGDHEDFERLVKTLLSSKMMRGLVGVQRRINE